jgi:hypothetical protein
MKTRSAREYTMLAPAQSLRSWYDQWPSNQGDLDSVSRRRMGESKTRDGAASDSVFVPNYVIVVGLLSKWYTLYVSIFATSYTEVFISQSEIHLLFISKLHLALKRTLVFKRLTIDILIIKKEVVRRLFAFTFDLSGTIN